MYQNTGGYSPISVVGLPHVRHSGELLTELHESGVRLVCLTFAAGWCEPCRSLMAQYWDIMRECEDVVFLLADVDECGGIQAYFRVTMVPTIVMIRDWNVIEMFVGCCPLRLRRRLNLYRDPESAEPPPKRTDLRRIYELIRDDTYMVTEQLREEQWEGEMPGEAVKPMEGEVEGEGAFAWKQRALIRGPKSLGLSFAPKPNFPHDKNWRIADAYITARRNKPPIPEDIIDTTTSDEDLPRVSVFMRPNWDDDDQSATGTPRTSYGEREELYEDEEEGEQWDDDLASFRQSNWYRSMYDEWSEKRGKARPKAEKPEDEEEAEAEEPKPRARGISFADGDESEHLQSIAKISAQGGFKPRSILKPRKTMNDDLQASPTWRKMQEEYRRRRTAFTQTMILTELEDRAYSRDEVMELMKRCQRTCTATHLDSQLQELVTDVAGQELMKSKRQKNLEESQARAARRVLLEAAARSKSNRFSVAPRQSVHPAFEDETDGPRSSRMVRPSTARSSVKHLRQSIAKTAAHRSPASSRASMSMDQDAQSALTAMAAAALNQSIEEKEGSFTKSVMEFGHVERRDSQENLTTHSPPTPEIVDQHTRRTEIMLEEAEAMREARESEFGDIPPSYPSEEKPKNPKGSKSIKVSFVAGQASSTSLRRSVEMTRMVETKKSRLSFSTDTSKDTDEEDKKKK